MQFWYPSTNQSWYYFTGTYELPTFTPEQIHRWWVESERWKYHRDPLATY